MSGSEHIDANTSTIEGLREYYHLNCLIVWNMHCEFEEHLQERAQKILENYRKKESYHEESASRELHCIQTQLTTQARYSFLPRFLSLFEAVIKSMCRMSNAEEYEKVGQRKWLKEHRSFLIKQRVVLDDIDGDFDTMSDLIVIRDCIVHANGEIDRCKRPDLVLKAINAIDTANVFKQDNMVSLGDQVIPTASIAISHIMIHLFKHFGCPLDWRRWH